MLLAVNHGIFREGVALLLKSPDPQAFERISNLHTRLRFDPEGLEEADRRALRQQLDWLGRHPVPAV